MWANHIVSIHYPSCSLIFGIIYPSALTNQPFPTPATHQFWSNSPSPLHQNLPLRRAPTQTHSFLPHINPTTPPSIFYITTTKLSPDLSRIPSAPFPTHQTSTPNPTPILCNICIPSTTTSSLPTTPCPAPNYHLPRNRYTRSRGIGPQHIASKAQSALLNLPNHPVLPVFVVIMLVATRVCRKAGF